MYPTFIHRDDLLEGLGSDENGYIGTSNIKFARMVGLDDVFTVVGLKEDAKGKVSFPIPQVNLWMTIFLSFQMWSKI